MTAEYPHWFRVFMEDCEQVRILEPVGRMASKRGVPGSWLEDGTLKRPDTCWGMRWDHMQ